MESKKNTSAGNTHDVYEKIDGNSRKLLIMSKDFEYMKAGIDDIKDSLNMLRSEVRSSYATKQDLKSISERIGKFESLYEWVLRIIIGAIVSGILLLLGFNRV